MMNLSPFSREQPARVPVLLCLCMLRSPWARPERSIMGATTSKQRHRSKRLAPCRWRTAPPTSLARRSPGGDAWSCARAPGHRRAFFRWTARRSPDLVFVAVSSNLCSRFTTRAAARRRREADPGPLPPSRRFYVNIVLALPLCSSFIKPLARSRPSSGRCAPASAKPTLLSLHGTLKRARSPWQSSSWS